MMSFHTSNVIVNRENLKEQIEKVACFHTSNVIVNLFSAKKFVKGIAVSIHQMLLLIK